MKMYMSFIFQCHIQPVHNILIGQRYTNYIMSTYILKADDIMKMNYSQATISEELSFDQKAYRPIDVVQCDGRYVSLDNRRLLAIKRAAVPIIEVKLRKQDDPIPTHYQQRFHLWVSFYTTGVHNTYNDMICIKLLPRTWKAVIMSKCARQGRNFSIKGTIIEPMVGDCPSSYHWPDEMTVRRILVDSDESMLNELRNAEDFFFCTDHYTPTNDNSSMKQFITEHFDDFISLFEISSVERWVDEHLIAASDMNSTNLDGLSLEEAVILLNEHERELLYVLQKECDLFEDQDNNSIAVRTDV